MSKTVKIVSTRQVDNVNAIVLQNSTLDGHGPISGVFEVWDADLSVYYDKGGVLTADVMCRLGESQDEDQTLELKFYGPLIKAVTGFSGEVIDAINLT